VALIESIGLAAARNRSHSVDHLLGQLAEAVAAVAAELLQGGGGKLGAVRAEEAAFRMFHRKLVLILTD
jgi:hypothetical protein